MSSTSKLISFLLYPPARSFALEELIRKANDPKVTWAVWTCPGVMPALIQELTLTYPVLTPTSLKLEPCQSRRVLLILKLFSFMAKTPLTTFYVIRTIVPHLIRLLEGCILKEFYEDWLQEIMQIIYNLAVNATGIDIQTLLLEGYKIIPLILEVIETVSGPSQLQAVRILKVLLMSRVFLNYVCDVYGRYVGVVLALTKAINQMDNALFGEIIQCFLRLSDHEQARWMLNRCLPCSITDVILYQRFPPSSPIVLCVQELIANLTITGYICHYDFLKNLPFPKEDGPIEGNDTCKFEMDFSEMPDKVSSGSDD